MKCFEIHALRNGQWKVDSMYDDRDIAMFEANRMEKSGRFMGIRVIEDSLAKAGASLRDVVRTRTFVTDIDLWPEIARAHQEAFGEVMPATSMDEVSRLIDPAMLVEIEADAIVAEV